MRLRSLWLALGWAGIGAVVWVTLTPSPPAPPFHFAALDKLEHLAAYFVLMGWFAQLYAGRARLAWLVGLIGLGVVLEVVQGMGGVRHFEYADMAANAAGAAVAWALARGGRDRLLAGLERYVSAGDRE